MGGCEFLRRTEVAISFCSDFLIPGLLNGEAFEKLIAGGARMGVEAARRENQRFCADSTMIFNTRGLQENEFARILRRFSFFKGDG